MSKESPLSNAPFLSFQEASVRVGLSVDYLQRLSRKGTLATRDVDGVKLVDVASLDSFVALRERAKEEKREKLSRERADEYLIRNAKLAMPAFRVEDRFVQPKIAAQESGLSIDYIQRLAKSDAIRTGKIGESVLIDRDSLHAFILERARKNATKREEVRKQRAKEYFISHLPLHEEITRFAHEHRTFSAAALAFGERAVALTLALMMIFGSYAVIDPRYASRAMEAVQAQLASPHSSLAAAGSLWPQSLSDIAKAINRAVDEMVYAVAFPDRLTQSGPRVAVEIQPYARPNYQQPATNNQQSIAKSESPVGSRELGVGRPLPRPGLGNGLGSGGSQSSTPTTVINQPVIERIVERVIPQRTVLEAGGLTDAYLNTKLNQLENKLASQMYALSNANSTTIVQNYGVTAQTNKIDELNNVEINNPTLTGGTIANTEMTGGSISNTSISASTLSVSGDATFASATTTNFFSTTASSTNLFSTYATTTYSFASVASSTALFATAATSSSFFANTLRATTATLDALTVTGASSFGGLLAVASSTIGGGTQISGLTISGGATTTGNAYFAGGLGIGIATSSAGVLQTSGNAWVGGNLLVMGDSTTLGNSSSNTLTINSSINSHIIPNQNITYDLGSASFYWRNAYVGNIVANNISAASTTIAGTASATFTVNSDNVSSDAEDMDLIFFRGNVVPNALLSWKSGASTKRFEFNQSLFVSNQSGSTTQPTLRLQGVTGQTGNLFEIASSTGTRMFSVDALGATLGNGFVSQASSTVVGNFTATGNAIFGGTFSVGTTTLTNLSVTNTSTSTFTGGLALATLAASGATTLASTLAVAGATTLANATSTSFFATTASSTALFSQSASLGALSAGTLAITSTLNLSGLATFASGFVSQASSTVVGNFTSTGIGTFASGVFTGSTGTTTIASGQGFTIGGSQFVLQQGSGNIGIGTTTPSTKLGVLASGGTEAILVTTGNGTKSSAMRVNSDGSGAFWAYDGAPGNIAAIYGAVETVHRSGGVLGWTGSAATAAGSPDTALSRLATGKVAIGNGTQGDASGILITNTLGLGTTSPYAKFAIAALAGNTAPLLSISTSTAAATSTAFHIDSNGRVGIGTAAPASSLEVRGTITATVSSGASSAFIANTGLFGGRTNNTNGQFFSMSDGNGSIIFTANVADTNGVSHGGPGYAVSFDAASNTSGPLGMRFGSSANIFMFGPQSFGTTSAQTLTTTFSANNWNGKDFLIIGGNTVGPQSVTGGDLYLAGGNGSGGGADGDVLLASYSSTASRGKVGVGTTTPWARLSVSATDNASAPQFVVASSSRIGFIVSNTGNVGINTATPGLAAVSDGGDTFLTVKARSGNRAGVIELAGDSGGNFGVGNPVGVVQFTNNVSGTDTAIASIRTSAFSANNQGQIHFMTRSGSGLVNAMTIHSNQNVGIGTSTPNTKLSVVGTHNTTQVNLLELGTSGGSLGTGNGILFTHAGQSVGGIRTLDDGSAKVSLRFDTYASSLVQNRMIITGDGNVGIGTTTPIRTLTVQGSTEQWIDSSTNWSTTQRSSGVIGLLGNRTAYFLNFDTANQRVGVGDASNPASLLAVAGNATIGAGYKATAAPSNGLLIEGKVGIGTTTPAQKLSLSGDSAAYSSISAISFNDSNIASADSRNWGIYNGASVYGSLDFKFSSTKNGNPDTGNAALTLMSAASGSGNVGVGSTSPFAKLSVRGFGSTTGINFQTTNSSNAPLFTILDSGNVGIGTTTPEFLLDLRGIGGNGSSGIRTSNPNSGNAIVIASNAASQGYLGFGAADSSLTPGAVRYNNATNALSLWTNSAQRLTVDTSGNVGIGTTTPVYKLDVFSSGSAPAGRFMSSNDGGGTGLRIDSTDTNQGIITGEFDSAGNPFLVVDSNLGPSGYLQFEESGTQMMRIGQTFAGGQNIAALGNLQIAIDSNNDGTGAFEIAKGSANGRVGTDGTSLFRINNDGKVGIGTTTPWAKLSMTATDNAAVPQFVVASSSAVSLMVAASGNVGIGMTSPSTIFQVGSTSVPLFKVDTSASTGGGAVISAGGNIDSNGYLLRLYSSQATAGRNQFNLYYQANDALGAIQSFNKYRGSGNELASGDDIGVIDFLGVTGGGSSQRSAQILAEADGASASGSAPGRMSFWTTPSGSATALERVTIKNDGNVGIGKTTPANTLHIATTSAGVVTNALLLENRNSTAGTGVAINFIASAADFSDQRYNSIASVNVSGSTSNDLTFSLSSGTAPAERVRITSTGNVGIGITSPASKLHVLGSSNDTVSQANANLNVEGGGGNGLVVGTISSSPFTSYIQSGFVDNFGTATYGLSLNPLGGNVGIGTTNPTLLLHVRGADGSGSTAQGATIAVGSDAAASINRGGSIIFGDAVPDRAMIKGAYEGSGSSGYLALSTRTSASGLAEVMRLTSTGNIGIGTTTPQGKLSVVSTATSALDLDFNSGVYAQRFTRNGQVIADIYKNASGPLIFESFATQGTTADISFGSNVGIGNTSPGVALDVTGSIRASGSVTVGSGGTYQAGTIYSDANWGMIFRAKQASPVAADFLFTNSADVHRMVIDPNGRLGLNDDTPDYRAEIVGTSGSGYLGVTSSTDGDIFAINASGNVGIGTNNPGARLDVTSTGATQCCNTVSPTLSLAENGAIKNPTIQFHSSGFQEAYIRLASSTRSIDIGDSQGTGTALGIMNAAGTSRTVSISGSALSYFNGGNVGIGTTSPTEKLSILSGDNTFGTNIFAVRANNLSQGVGIGYSAVRAIGTNANVDLNLQSQGTGGIYTYTNGSIRTTVDGSGNVGIGTTTPWAKLSVTATDNTSVPQFVVASSTAVSFMVSSSGNVSINNLTASRLLATDGSKNLVSTITAANLLSSVSGTTGTGNLVFATSPTITLGNASGLPIDGGTTGTLPVGRGGTGVTSSTGSGSVVLNTSPAFAGNVSLGTASASVLFVTAVNLDGYYACLRAGVDDRIGYNTTCSQSDERLKENIQTLAGGTGGRGLDAIRQLRAVEFDWKDQRRKEMDGHQLGLIAQEVSPLYPELIGTTPGTTTITLADGTKQDFANTRTLNYMQLTAPMVLAIQELDAQVQAQQEATTTANVIATVSTGFEWSSFSSGISEGLRSAMQEIGNMAVTVFKGAIYATAGIFDKVFAKEVTTDSLCVSDASGKTCVTRAQLDALLAGAAAPSAPSSPSAPSESGTGGQDPNAPDTEAPVITVTGANPATIDVGALYSDLGATVFDAGSPNIGISATVNGGATTTPESIWIDTSVPGTHTIIYSATDQAGNTGTAERIVNVVAPASDTGSAPVVDLFTGTTTPAEITPTAPAVTDTATSTTSTTP